MGALAGSGSVFKELDRIFKNPNSNEYGIAQGQKALFGTVGRGDGNWSDLVNAYRKVGVNVSDLWADYIQHNLSPTSIHSIAQARYYALTLGVAMNVDKHIPDGKVVVTIEDDGSISINSPYN